MKKYLKSVLLILLVCLFGCNYFQKDITTESGQKLSNSFKSVNLILESSKEFYNTTLSIAGEAYSKGYLSEEQKTEVIKVGRVYRDLHNDASRAVLDWYIAIDTQSNEVDKTRKRAIVFLFELIENGKTLNGLLSEYLKDKMDLPENAVPTFFNLVQSLKPLLT